MRIKIVQASVTWCKAKDSSGPNSVMNCVKPHIRIPRIFYNQWVVDGTLYVYIIF